MGIFELIMMIALCGLVVWGVTTLIPMPPPFKNAIYVIATIALVIYVLQTFGLFHGFHDIKIKK